MSCDITNGRVEECKDSVSGLKAIYFANFDDLDTDKYELKSNENSFTTAVQTSRDNGTTFFEQTLQISLKKQDFAMHKNIKLLAYGRPRIIVRTMTDQFFLMGLAQGCDTTAGEISSGAALGDFNGYKLTFVASEVLPANFIDITSQGELQVAFADSAGTAATITTT